MKKPIKTENKATKIILNLLGAFFIFLGILAYGATLMYGNQYQVFWICYLSLILLGIGILRRSSFLIVSQINLLLITDIIWIIDFISFFVNGQTLWGITSYMFTNRPTISNFISLQHIFSMPLALIALYKIKIKRSDAWKLSTFQFIIMGVITVVGTPIEANVNCVFKPCMPIALGLIPHQIVWLLTFFIMVFLTNKMLTSTKIFNEKEKQR